MREREYIYFTTESGRGYVLNLTDWLIMRIDGGSSDGWVAGGLLPGVRTVGPGEQPNICYQGQVFPTSTVRTASWHHEEPPAARAALGHRAYRRSLRPAAEPLAARMDRMDLDPFDCRFFQVPSGL